MKKSYEETHKEIDGIIYKHCHDCNDWHPMNEEWFYKNKSAPDGFHPYCKEVAKNKARKRQLENHETYLNYMSSYNKNYYNIPEKQIKQKETSKKRRLNGKYKEWQMNNPEKIREYNKSREMHKKHDITDQEWFKCLDYFNNSCAYCGLSEKEQFEIYNERLHMEHVDHNGSNYIDNCVPSCTSCNTAKNTKELNEWYNEDNIIFSKRRYNKIVNWITKECFKILNIQ